MTPFAFLCFLFYQGVGYWSMVISRRHRGIGERSRAGTRAIRSSNSELTLLVGKRPSRSYDSPLGPIAGPCGVGDLYNPFLSLDLCPRRYLQTVIDVKRVQSTFLRRLWTVLSKTFQGLAAPEAVREPLHDLHFLQVWFLGHSRLRLCFSYGQVGRP